MADSTLPDKIINSVLGKIFILTLQTVLSSMVLLLAILFRQAVDITLLKYSIVILVGILAGFSTRRFLKGHTLILKLLVSLLTTALSLAVLYTLSTGFLGINLFYQSNSFPDWQGLIQLGAAAVGAFLVLLAFRTPSPVVDMAISPPPSQISSPGLRQEIKPSPAPAVKQKPSPKVTRGSAKKNGAGPRKKSTALKVEPSKTNQKTTAKKTTAKKIKKPAAKKTAPNKLALKPAPTLKKKTTRSKKKVKKEIKFVGDMEHTCPYCLDPVMDHDPRGVKICPICKTRHHADCWGITGACQIPHSHE